VIGTQTGSFDCWDRMALLAKGNGGWGRRPIAGPPSHESAPLPELYKMCAMMLTLLALGSAG